MRHGMRVVAHWPRTLPHSRSARSGSPPVLTPTNQNQRSSTLHPHHGVPIDLACWYCHLYFGSAGSAPSRPCPDLDLSICPWMHPPLASLRHSQRGWRLVQLPPPFLHSEALSRESVVSALLGLFSLSRELQPHWPQEMGRKPLQTPRHRAECA